MKTLKLFIIGLLFITTSNSQAQVSVNVNLGKPPVWAPANRVETQYYYLPDVDAYYDVPAERFIYRNNGTWIRSTVLPARYKSYNLSGANIIYLTDYKGNSPYVYHKNHIVKYKKIKSNNRTIVVKQKKYKANKANGHDNGKRKNNNKGKGNKD
ncbi:hypothetical protein [Flavobacterium sp.]|uniref:hypothetical protein n=1 Tax=Flavobacterium sp. TaxID=239 RepID=UPI00375070DB